MRASWLPILILAIRTSPVFAQQLDVRLDTEQAEAVLAIVALGDRATDADWRALFDSEGYRRLKQRELGLQRPFPDSAFRAFVLDTAMVRRAPSLKQALVAWKSVDASAAARRAFEFLPADARIRAAIYPVIKPRTNTFVFEPRTNPAIFFYLDPAISPEKFENTLAHELHHLGVASACPTDTTRPLAVQWMGGFAEGRAMLAAAGSPDVHPHATSDADERMGWERAYANAARDMQRMETFYIGLFDGTIPAAEQSRRGYEFVNTDSVPQGPYYTVGYLMSATVERELGRQRLVESLCDPRQFLLDYNEAAARHAQKGGAALPIWSSTLIGRLK